MAGKIVPVAMPKWGMEMVEGQINRWNKNEGDKVTPGEELLEIEIDKMTNVYEAEVAGILRRRLAREGEIYPVGRLLAVIADEGVTDTEIDRFVASYGDATPKAEIAPSAQSGSDASAPAQSNRLDQKAASARIAALASEISPLAVRLAIAEGIDVQGISGTGRLGRISVHDLEQKAGRTLTPQRVNASPRARALARRHGVDLQTLRGSGPGGRILAIDVGASRPTDGMARSGLGQNAVSAGPAQRIGVPNSAARRTIARRLVQSKATTPHIYLRTSADAGALKQLRESFKRRLPEAKISLNDLIVRAAGLALAEVPDVNVQYTDETLFRFDQADVAVAIALPHGLVAPVIRGVDRKPVTQISREIRALAERAQAGQLTAADVEGGTFTVSNLGMFGIESFDAVINPPQAAILAVGAAVDRAVGIDGVMSLRPMMGLTLSCDHRAIDGAVGARYLSALKALIEEPITLVL